ncbi:bleomycin resistance protein [Microbacterium marinilacus]|uniref:Bleomycin resistance protein n=1 Tax=Microbacterium marinilacus TaxID=415209 RepID=A0ABP7B358_9MICO|nr:VOC family protein [Microbacterium marinilacus]MBY0687925.1 VOC family protein [Microbacterium marinilacus]
MTSPADPGLVPELLVTDTRASMAFWCDLCGFSIDYQREDEGFAYISSGSAHVMLEQQGIGRNWVTAPLDRPLGRGVNFQISVPDVEPIILALHEAGHPLFMEPETRWYRIGAEEAGVRQFLVADPDGYLLRFQMSLGRRPLSPTAERPISLSAGRSPSR